MLVDSVKSMWTIPGMNPTWFDMIWQDRIWYDMIFLDFLDMSDFRSTWFNISWMGSSTSTRSTINQLHHRTMQPSVGVAFRHMPLRVLWRRTMGGVVHMGPWMLQNGMDWNWGRTLRMLVAIYSLSMWFWTVFVSIFEKDVNNIISTMMTVTQSKEASGFTPSEARVRTSAQ